MRIVTDPVCGKEFEADEAQGATLYTDYEVTRFYFCSPCSSQQKWRFYFCSPECKSVFDRAPGFYSGLADDDSPSTRPDPPVLV